MRVNTLALSALALGLAFTAACSKSSSSKAASSPASNSDDDSNDPNVSQDARDALGFSSNTPDGTVDLSGVYGRALKTTWAQQEGDEGPIALSQFTLNSDGTYTGRAYGGSEAAVSGTYAVTSTSFAGQDGVTRKFPQITFKGIPAANGPYQVGLSVSKDGKSISLDDSNAYYMSPVYQ